MTAALNEKQSLALVQRLAEDDAFRALFESDPAGALEELGVDGSLARTMIEQASASRSTCVLASKERFAALVPEMQDPAKRAALFFIVPQCKLS